MDRRFVLRNLDENPPEDSAEVVAAALIVPKDAVLFGSFGAVFLEWPALPDGKLMPSPEILNSVKSAVGRDPAVSRIDATLIDPSQSSHRNLYPEIDQLDANSALGALANQETAFLFNAPLRLEIDPAAAKVPVILPRPDRVHVRWDGGPYIAFTPILANKNPFNDGGVIVREVLDRSLIEGEVPHLVQPPSIASTDLIVSVDATAIDPQVNVLVDGPNRRLVELRLPDQGLKTEELCDLAYFVLLDVCRAFYFIANDRMASEDLADVGNGLVSNILKQQHERYGVPRWRLIQRFKHWITSGRKSRYEVAALYRVAALFEVRRRAGASSIDDYGAECDVLPGVQGVFRRDVADAARVFQSADPTTWLRTADLFVQQAGNRSVSAATWAAALIGGAVGAAITHFLK